MSMHHERSALNNALSQLNRIGHAPAPMRVKVDGRSLADLLSFAAEYGALIQYYDLTDKPDGDWSTFFLGDKSVTLALCAALDLSDIEIELDRFLHTLCKAKAIEHWLIHWPILTRVIVRLVRIIGHAEVPHATLEHALAYLTTPNRVELMAEPARRVIYHFGGEAHELRLRRERIGSAWLTELHQLLDDLVAALIITLAQIRNNAITELESSLHDQQHPPQSGLWDAFAQLFRHAQKTINRFPQHLVRFYQTSILRQDERAERPDQLVLTFTPAAGTVQVTLDKGTAFTAGDDEDGESNVYALDSALTVDATSVAALRTITLASQPIAPGAPPTPAQVLSGVVKLSPTPPAIASPFPLFGANTAGLDGALASTKASLGFAVASPCLMLAGGNRTIQLALSISPESVSTLTSMLNEICGNTNIEWQSVLAQLFERAFSLRYSSISGWIAIPSYQVAAPTDNDGLFILSFQLDLDADAWTTFPQPPTGGTGPYVNTPTLFATLLQEPVAVDLIDFPIYPYAVLSHVALSSMSIQVDVADLADLQIAGPAGPMDASQPFALFGSPPVQYASLSVTAPELFVKQLNYFSMSIDWFGLPVTSTGFKGYYEAYVIDADGNTVRPGTLFDNDNFTAGIEVINPGLWKFDPTIAPQLLFQTDDDSALSPPPLLPQTVLCQPTVTNAAGDYYNPAMSYVRLRLETPDYAFGNILYAPNVMAASVQLTAAASACAMKCGHDNWAAAAASQLEPIATASTTADDDEFDKRIKVAVQQAVSGLDGAALNAIENAIAQSDVTADQKSAWRTSVSAALSKPKSRPLLQRVRNLSKRDPDFTTVHANLEQWLADHSATLAAMAPALTSQAQTLLSAGSDALTLQAKVADTPVSTARPVVTAGVRTMQADLKDAAEQSSDECTHNCMSASSNYGFPNQPWLPIAKSVRVSYSANAMLPPSTDQAGAADTTYFHLCPFDEIEAVNWQAGEIIPLLAPITQSGSLYIDLSTAAQTLSLLFQLAPPASGWPTNTPTPYWSQATGAASWRALTPQSDATDGLRHSGIVRFALHDWPDDAPLRLCVGFTSGNAALFPLLSDLATNAATATWQGPGRAAQLGTPIAAGKVTKLVVALPGIGGIQQPMASFGGQARAVDAAFDVWLAERLRHKDYGIQAWDYANLVLAAFPSLWQVAVVPASNGSLGQAPGHVWIVPVPGPKTAAIVDPTIPSNDGQVLSEIAAFLAARISPFIQLNVTNPPYIRLTVHAEILFTDDNAVQACITKLNDELIDFLSPWPSQIVGLRPKNYYTRQEVAQFVRQRPYVRGILSLNLIPDKADFAAARPYYTSALAHVLKGESSPASELLRRPNFALPTTTSMALGEAT